MTRLSKVLSRTTVAAAVSLAMFGRADAATIGVDNANPQNIPGLTGYVTTGANMNGMTVTARFNNGDFETLTWAATGLESGGVTGDNWSLSLTGDSFLSSWSFVNDKAGKLTELILDGSTGLTVFDKREPDFGTDGSFSGLDFTSALGGDDLLATYRNPISVGGAAQVGDLFQILHLDFRGLQGKGTNDSFTFKQDTDNDSRIVADSLTSRQVPEPTLLALFGLGLVGAARARRRTRA